VLRLTAVVLEPTPFIFGPEIIGWPSLVLGGVGIVFSAALGFAGLRVAVKTELSTAPKVFARGIAGVTSVLAFFASGSLVIFGLACLNKLSERSFPVWFVVAGVSFACLAIEFGIGGALYRRARPTVATRLLSVASFLLVPLLGLLALLAIAVGVINWIHPPP
jgi:hypothetical protein